MSKGSIKNAVGSKVVPPVLANGAKRIMIKKMEEDQLTPISEQAQKEESKPSSTEVEEKSEKVTENQVPAEIVTPNKLYTDGDMFVHVLKLVTDRMNSSRENGFTDLSFSFIEADMLRKLLSAGAERTERFNQYYNQVINREGAIGKVLGEALPPIIEKLGLLNSLKDSINRGLKQ